MGDVTTAPDAVDAAADRGAPVHSDASDEAPPTCAAVITVVDGGLAADAAADADADAELVCDYLFACGVPVGVATVGCSIVPALRDGAPDPDAMPMKCRLLEGMGCLADAFAPTESGAVTMECIDCLSGGGGRRTAGVAPPRVAAGGAGAYFARMAHAEAASIFAFRRMREELACHGAPRDLATAARRAATDEVRHARAMRALATEHGATPPPVRVRRPRGPRSLEAFARENAVEGCVHETFLAIVACHQAAHAADGRLRRTFARIAADETRHAALAWAVARWADGRLDAAARARLARARDAAIGRLRRTLEQRETTGLDAVVGNPSGAAAVLLLEAMVAALTPSGGTAPSARRRPGTARGGRGAPAGTAA